ncbi:MAG: hypothetical protein AAGU15_10720 [Anaerolineaceae bacterium]
MKYKIVQAKNEYNAPYLLTEKVNLLIQKGWKPLGGISTLLTPNYFFYFQTMVKEDDSSEDEELNIDED